jgi:hypothetical protein
MIRPRGTSLNADVAQYFIDIIAQGNGTQHAEPR